MVHLTVQTWPSGTQHLRSNTNKYTHLPITDRAICLTIYFRQKYDFEQVASTCKQRREQLFTFIFRLFGDVIQLPQTLILLCIPKKRKRNNNISRFCLTKKECFSVSYTFIPPDITIATSYQMELGRECTLVTPPSTGTKICTLVSGPGEAIDSGLYR